MKLDEALTKLDKAGALVESTTPVISLEEFNRQVRRRDKGWVIGKLNDNHNPSAPWTLTKEGIGQIRFSVWVHTDGDSDAPRIAVDVRGLCCEPEEGAFQNIYKIYNDIFGVK